MLGRAHSSAPQVNQTLSGLLTDDWVLKIRETGSHWPIGAVYRQIDAYWELFCQEFQGRSERFALYVESEESAAGSGVDFAGEADLLEVGNQVLPAPSPITKCFPSIIVPSRATIEEHAINDCSASDNCRRVYGTASTI